MMVNVYFNDLKNRFTLLGKRRVLHGENYFTSDLKNRFTYYLCF